MINFLNHSQLPRRYKTPAKDNTPGEGGDSKPDITGNSARRSLDMNNTTGIDESIGDISFCPSAESTVLVGEDGDKTMTEENVS